MQQLRKQAKDLLREYQHGSEPARERMAGARGAALADAQLVIAREYGFDTWASLKQHVENERLREYRAWADDVFRACERGDGEALERVRALFGGSFTHEELAQRVKHRMGIAAGEPLTPASARLFAARVSGFGSWAELESASADKGGAAAFHQVDIEKNSIEPRPPVSMRAWEELFDAMRSHGITGLRAAGQMTDAALERLAALDFVTSLDLEGSRRVTDHGLSHLRRMPQLEHLNLTGCGITDTGLAVLGELSQLRRFHLYHHGGVSDAGLAHLAGCHRLERVDLLGSNSGDDLLRALAGKNALRHLKSGNHVTDAGLAWLEEYPVFRTWQGGEPDLSLMGFDAGPTYLLVRGAITEAGMERLARLDGLFALNLDDSRLDLPARALTPLARMAHLEWLGFDADDEAMAAIARLPHLRMLMCQDTRAGDTGFTALSRSATLEYLWGRRCYNLAGAGFRAMAAMPALRGLSVSCRNVDDASLSALPSFPRLVEFMPMDVPDEGFRHVGRCERLEALWCMYCRETGDRATELIGGLRLRSYYAGQTRITDTSLEILSRMETLERMTLYACAGVTHAGVAALAGLPRLRELRLEAMPAIGGGVAAGFPERVRVWVER
ncbi:MAG: hypothetical protein R2762_30015 [Bryobacteraceae bacterium]